MLAFGFAALAIGIQTPAPLVWYTTLEGERRAAEDGLLMPGRSMVRKGSVIVVRGSLRDPQNPAAPASGRIYLRTNGDTRASAQVKGDFLLTWDTRSESRPVIKAQVRFLLDGQSQETLIRSCDVTLADTDPLGATLESSSNGSTLLLTTAPGIDLDDPKFYLDGRELTLRKQEGKYLLEQKFLSSPNPDARLQIVSAATKSGEKIGQIMAPPVSVKCRQDMTVTDDGLGLSLPENPFETYFTLGIEGATAAGSARIILNGREIPAERNGATVMFDPRDCQGEQTGYLYVRGIDAEGQPTYSRKLSLQELKLAEHWNGLAGKIDEERARLRRVFELDLPECAGLKFDKILRLNMGTYSKGPEKAESEPRSPLKSGSGVAGGRGPAPSKLKAIGGGLTVRTARVVPVYGAIDQVAREFPDYWSKQTWIGSALRTKIGEWSDSAALRRSLSFAGPYHRKLIDNFVSSVEEWSDAILAAKAACASAKGSPNQITVQDFCKAMNACEAQRLKSVRVYTLLKVETGNPVEPIVLYNFIPVPRDQNDTEVVTGRYYEGFDYLGSKIDARLFP